MKIGNYKLGSAHPCMIVAEMSGNHGQDFDRALAIVRAAADAGADAIKMQAYTADTITLDHDSRDFLIPSGNSWAAHATLHRLYAEAYTPWDWFEPLTAEANRLGMEAFCSVFDHSSVEHMESIGTVAYKIAAPEITDIPLLRRVAATGKPVILSTGLAALDDITLATDTLRRAGCRDIVVLKCTTEYPAPVDQANLRTIPDIAERFDCLAGLSDHTTALAVPVAAATLGATMIEKHFTLDDMQTVDSFFSLTPERFRQMVDEVRLAEAAIGDVDYRIKSIGDDSLDGRRSLYACRDIAIGESFDAGNVRSVRPAYGLHPKHWDALMGQRARRPIRFGDRIEPGDLEPSDD